MQLTLELFSESILKYAEIFMGNQKAFEKYFWKMCANDILLDRSQKAISRVLEG
jgi:hypothetical protein